MANETLLAEIDRDWLKIAPFLLDYNDTVLPHQKDETSLKIKEYYMKGQPISRATTAPFIQVNIFRWLNNVKLIINIQVIKMCRNKRQRGVGN